MKLGAGILIGSIVGALIVVFFLVKLLEWIF